MSTLSRKDREELKALSKEFFGGAGKYRKFVKGINVPGNELAPNGKPIKVVKRQTENEVLQTLRVLKSQRNSEELAKQIQKEAAGSAK